MKVIIGRLGDRFHLNKACVVCLLTPNENYISITIYCQLSHLDICKYVLIESQLLMFHLTRLILEIV